MKTLLLINGNDTSSVAWLQAQPLSTSSVVVQVRTKKTRSERSSPTTFPAREWNECQELDGDVIKEGFFCIKSLRPETYFLPETYIINKWDIVRGYRVYRVCRCICTGVVAQHGGKLFLDWRRVV